MNIAEMTGGELGVYQATKAPYVIHKGKKALKVAEPYYSKKERMITAFCPYCGLELNRVWNMEYCGSCGGQVSWHDISVRDYGDIP